MQPSHGFLALAAALLCVLSAPVCAATGAEEPTCKSDGCGAHVLTYFPSVRVIPGGRGEAVRIALHAAGIKHEDKHMIYSEYTELKAKTDDWVWKNGLPILSVDGKEFTQSVAALRYAGKKAVDEILDITQDILTKTPMGEDQAKKMDPSVPWIVGNEMTVADLALKFMLMVMVRDGDFDGVPTTFFDEFPALARMEKDVMEHPLVAAWFASK